MTTIKTEALSSEAEVRNLRKYINDDRKVLLRDSQNMEDCVDIKRWATFMEATRRRYGHDKASRHIRDKETGELVEAKNSLMLHHILAFKLSDCDANGGKMTPERCMAYAKEYAERYYPNQEVVFALQDEYCWTRRAHRYAVHMVVNRSDIVTGKRLNEGLARAVMIEYAKRVRALDEEWDLHRFSPNTDADRQMEESIGGDEVRTGGETALHKGGIE